MSMEFGHYDFKLEDYVVFSACPRTLFQIVGGASPFWNLKHVGGPKLTDNYHRTLFGLRPPMRDAVIETVLAPVNEMMVLAIMASEE
jgi:hypothetical protein